MFKKLLYLLAVTCGLSLPTLAATSTYTVYPTAGSVVCGSDAVCSTIKHLSVQTVTISGTAGTALYTWNASCPSSPDAIFYIRPTGATTGCFVLEGFGPSTGGVTALAGTTNQITVSSSTGSVTLSLPSILIAPGTFSSTNLNVSGSTPSANGLYLPSANTLGVSVNSTQVGRFTSTGLNATNIGVTTPGTGSFTALSSSGNITSNITGSVQCIKTNSSGVLSGTASPTACLPRNVFYSTSGSSANTSSATVVMMGFGSAWVLTPVVGGSGSVRLTMFGYYSGAIVGTSLADFQVVYGTGSAPSNGTASTGTSFSASGYNPTAPITAQIPITVIAEATGLTPGTAYWFDIRFRSGGTGGLASVGINTITIEEIR